MFLFHDFDYFINYTINQIELFYNFIKRFTNFSFNASTQSLLLNIWRKHQKNNVIFHSISPAPANLFADLNFQLFFQLKFNAHSTKNNRAQRGRLEIFIRHAE